MALTLHKVMADGSVIHEPFTREAWEAAIVDPAVRRRWGHEPSDCRDFVAEHVASYAREVVPTFVETPWPPDSELTPSALSEMTTLSLAEAKAILRPLPEIEKGPPTDRRGQLSLF